MGNIKKSPTGAADAQTAVPSSRRIDTTTPLQGGGDLSADRVFSIDLSGIDGSVDAIHAGANIDVAPNPLITSGSVALSNPITGTQYFDGHVIFRENIQVSGTAYHYGPIYQATAPVIPPVTYEASGVVVVDRQASFIQVSGVQQTLYSYTVPGGTLGSGSAVRVSLVGAVLPSGQPTANVTNYHYRVRYGDTVLYSGGVQFGPSDNVRVANPWLLDFSILLAGRGTTGKQSAYGALRTSATSLGEFTRLTASGQLSPNWLVSTTATQHWGLHEYCEEDSTQDKNLDIIVTHHINGASAPVDFWTQRWSAQAEWLSPGDVPWNKVLDSKCFPVQVSGQTEQVIYSYTVPGGTLSSGNALRFRSYANRGAKVGDPNDGAILRFGGILVASGIGDGTFDALISAIGSESQQASFGTPYIAFGLIGAGNMIGSGIASTMEFANRGGHSWMNLDSTQDQEITLSVRPRTFADHAVRLHYAYTELIQAGEGNDSRVTSLDRTLGRSVRVSGTTPVRAYSFTVPGGTLSTNKAIRFHAIGRNRRASGGVFPSFSLGYGDSLIVSGTMAPTDADTDETIFDIEGILAAKDSTGAQAAYAFAGIQRTAGSPMTSGGSDLFNYRGGGGSPWLTEDSTQDRTFFLDLSTSAWDENTTLILDSMQLELLDPSPFEAPGESRYLTSGEIGPVIARLEVNASGILPHQSVYWTGQEHVFSPGTTVTVSGALRLGQHGNTRVSQAGDVQVSGTEVVYGPAYHGAISGPNRFLPSGELATGGGSGTVTSVDVGTNIASQPNPITTSGSIGLANPLSGPLYEGAISAGQRYVTSGEMQGAGGSGTVTSVAFGTNFTAQPNPITVTGSVGLANPLTGPLYVGAIADEQRILVSGELRPVSIVPGSNIAQQPNPITGSGSIGLANPLTGPLYEGAVSDAQRYVTSGELSAGGGTGTVTNLVAGGNIALQPSTITVTGSIGLRSPLVEPLFAGSVSGPARYIPSGELQTGVGTGDFVKGAENYVTGTPQVFGPSTTVQISGEARFGSHGNTRINGAGDLQASGQGTTIYSPNIILHSSDDQGAIFDLNQDIGDGQKSRLILGGNSDPTGTLTGGAGIIRFLVEAESPDFGLFGAWRAGQIGLDAPAKFFFIGSRGTLTSPTTSQDGDAMGALTFVGFDADNDLAAAGGEESLAIYGIVDGTAGSSFDVPGSMRIFNMDRDSNYESGIIMRHDRKVGIGTGFTNPLARLHVQSSGTGELTSIFEAGAGQTSDVAQWRRSTGAVVASVGESGNVMVSGQSLHYAPIYHRQIAGPNRYVTSGELQPPGAGSGDFIKAQANYVTGSPQVFGPSSTVQVSGLATFGATGQTKVESTGDVTISGGSAASSRALRVLNRTAPVRIGQPPNDGGPGTYAHLFRAGSLVTRIESIFNGDGPVLELRAARGTIQAPTEPTAGMALGSITLWGGTGIVDGYANRATIESLATQAWSGTNRGTKLTLAGTANNSNTSVPALQVQDTVTVSGLQLNYAEARFQRPVRIGPNSSPSALVHVTASGVGGEVARFESTSASDDPNYIVRQGRITTTDATPTNVFSFTPDASKTYLVHAYVVARRTGGSAGSTDDGAGYVRFATFQGTGPTQIGTTAATASHENQAGYASDIQVSGSNLVVVVVGEANTNITWHATVIIQSVGS